ncbi:DUF3772 domain-containing protein [Roseibium algae]|uniref:DUF3772 domain-containing protein n=1 Tax=Roseibium algae TaxID=3123038 RepID=A0ABU8TNU7_9HYPH
MALARISRAVCFVLLAGCLVVPAVAQENFGVLGKDGEIIPSPTATQIEAPADTERGSKQSHISPLQSDFSTLGIAPNTFIDSGEYDQLQIRIDGLSSRLNTIEAAVSRGNLAASTIYGLEQRVFNVQESADAIVSSLRPALQSVGRNLSELTPAEVQQNEPASLLAQREKFQNLQQAMTALSKQAQVVGFQAQELGSRISEQRRLALRAEMLHRTDGILSAQLWARAFADLSAALVSLETLARGWATTVEGRLGVLGVPGLALYFFAAIPLIWRLRRWLLGKAARDPDITDPDNGLKAKAAVLIVLSSVLAPLVVGVFFYSAVNLLGVSSDQINNGLKAIFGGILFATFTIGLSSAMFAPSLPHWRIDEVGDAEASTAYRLSFVAASVYAIFLAFFILFGSLSDVTFLRAAMTGILSVGVSLCTIQILRSARAFPSEDAEDYISIRGIWPWLKPLMWVGAFVSFCAPFAGYISLGGFVSAQIIWTLLSFFTLSLLLRFVEHWLAPSFSLDRPIGRVLHATFGLPSATLEQIGVLLSGLVKLSLLALVVMGLLVPWGYSTGDILGLADKIFSSMQIGSAAISLSSVVGAVLLFAVIAFSTKATQRWLEKKYLPKTRMDIGLQTSVTTGFGYVGYIIAGLAALAFTGLNLQNIAIVAGALSVGVGLGLQGIVNNFVSGLVVLAERPIKVGDWVIIGENQGYVRRINVRATEIETFDRSTVIIPNSSLISDVVTNWMHNNSTGRITVAVGVSYDSDPEQVREILRDCASSHPGVMSYPAPQVYFMDFGDSSLNFEMRCFLPNIERALEVGSDLRFAVFRKLAEAKIEIPFPQRDLNIRSGSFNNQGGNNAVPLPGLANDRTDG